MTIDYKALQKRLEGKYSEKTVLFVKAYVGEVESRAKMSRKDALFFNRSQDNPYYDLIDEMIGKPLRELKALREQIKNDLAIATYVLTGQKLAYVSVKLDRAGEILNGSIQEQLDNLKAAMNRGLRPASSSTTSGPPEVYTRIAEMKDAKQHENLCLW